MRYIYVLMLLMFVSCGRKESPCTVTPTDTGSIIQCPDGSTASISNGFDGSVGLTGQTGAVGQSGASGSQGVAGQDGKTSLITEIAAGIDVCPTGGFIFSMGVDSNSDETLQTEETTQVAVLCNGPQGDTGAQGIAGPQGSVGLTGASGTAGGTPFTPVSLITPCGANSSPWKEVIMCLNNGQLLKDYSRTSNSTTSRLALVPVGSFTDSDSSGCVFTVSIEPDGLSRKVSWSAGHNSYATWVAGNSICLSN